MTASPEKAGEAVPGTRRIQLDPMVVLGEKMALIEHLENRNLALAQQLHEARQTIEKQDEALAAIEPKKG